MTVPETVFPAEQLRAFVEATFVHLGVPATEAVTAADVLITSDLRGIDSHGVARLPTYVDSLQVGMINPTPTIRVVQETASTATVDGGNGLGLVVGPAANAVAMDKAAEAGTAWVSVRNTNHYGIAGYYALKAVERGLIGWSMTNTSAIVAPLWGGEARLGTNPIAVGFPAGMEPPIILDMATSAVAFGKVEIAARKGDPIPDGWAIGRDGRTTNDPAAVLPGALLPLGSTKEMGGHKGYGLAIVVDLLCAVLSGANWGPWAPPFSPGLPFPERSVGLGIGHFFGAMRVDAFIDPAHFSAQMDDFIRTMRSTTPQPGTSGPILPGDPEREAHEVRATAGIPLLQPVVDNLRRIADDLGVPLG